MANLLGKAIGGLLGGIIIDLMQFAFGSAFPAYATLFGFEVVILIAALVMTTRLDIEKALAQSEMIQVPA